MLKFSLFTCHSALSLMERLFKARIASKALKSRQTVMRMKSSGMTLLAKPHAAVERANLLVAAGLPAGRGGALAREALAA